MIRFVLTISLACCAVASAQQSGKTWDLAKAPYFEMLIEFAKAPTFESATIDATSITKEHMVVRAEGPVKFVKLPEAFDDYWVAAAGEGADAKIVTEDAYWMVNFHPYLYGKGGGHKAKVVSPERVVREDGRFEYVYSKHVDSAGWFESGGPGVAEAKPPVAYFDAIRAVDGVNPVKAPTLDDKAIVLDGMKVHVESPAKFMKLPDDVKPFWCVPVPSGTKGRVAVDSPRWQVDFLPFENGKTAMIGPTRARLIGEPIVRDGKEVGWIYSKPSAAGGWFVVVGLLPEKRP